MIGFNGVIRVLLGDGARGGYQLLDHPRVGGCPSTPQLLVTTSASVTSPRYSLLMAQQQADVRAAQRLRHRVFAGEMGAVLHTPEPGLDIDYYDAHCDHLVVREDSTGEIVGTYRMLSPDGARRAGGLYCETEFLIPTLAGLRETLVETGRSCVHPDHRTGAVVNLVWVPVSPCGAGCLPPADAVPTVTRTRRLLRLLAVGATLLAGVVLAVVLPLVSPAGWEQILRAWPSDRFRRARPGAAWLVDGSGRRCFRPPSTPRQQCGRWRCATAWPVLVPPRWPLSSVPRRCGRPWCAVPECGAWWWRCTYGRCCSPPGPIAVCWRLAPRPPLPLPRDP
jgi:GNAT acetyltransferase-like protein